MKFGWPKFKCGWKSICSPHVCEVRMPEESPLLIFMTCSCLLLINTGLFPDYSLATPLLQGHSNTHPFLSQRLHHSSPEPLHLQAKYVEFVSHQAHTQLNSCTPIGDSPCFFVFYWEGEDRMRWPLPRRFLSCII